MGKNERSDQNDNKNDFLAHAVGKEIIKNFGSLYMWGVIFIISTSSLVWVSHTSSFNSYSSPTFASFYDRKSIEFFWTVFFLDNVLFKMK